jgi:hypothetical protein
MPAAKKDPSTRAGRAKAATRSTLRPLTAGEIDIPPLPDAPDGEGWHPQVLEFWRTVWSSPMAAEYVEADLRGLYIIAMLEQTLWTAETLTQRMSAMAEIRLARKDYGLTPYDRRRLEWSIESAEDAKDRGQSRRTRQATPRPVGDDARHALYSA